MISPFLSQIVDPVSFKDLGINPLDYKGFAIKSRVHFRPGFYDSGFAKTILLTEPDQPFVGTVHLEALNYKYLAGRRSNCSARTTYPAAGGNDLIIVEWCGPSNGSVMRASRAAHPLGWWVVPATKALGRRVFYAALFLVGD